MKAVIWYFDEDFRCVGREVKDFPNTNHGKFLRIWIIKDKPWKGTTTRWLTEEEFEEELRKGVPKSLDQLY